MPRLTSVTVRYSYEVDGHRVRHSVTIYARKSQEPDGKKEKAPGPKKRPRR